MLIAKVHANQDSEECTYRWQYLILSGGKWKSRMNRSRIVNQARLQCFDSAYLIIPRWLRSTKVARIAASSPSIALIFSSACVVFSLAASSMRKAFCSVCSL